MYVLYLTHIFLNKQYELTVYRYHGVQIPLVVTGYSPLCKSISRIRHITINSINCILYRLYFISYYFISLTDR